MAVIEIKPDDPQKERERLLKIEAGVRRLRRLLMDMLRIQTAKDFGVSAKAMEEELEKILEGEAVRKDGTDV